MRSMTRIYTRLRTLAAAAIAGALLAPAISTSAAGADEARISGPHIHENLAVYLVHGASAAGPVPLTLQEAIAKAAVRVTETGSVNQLEIENTGTEDVFVQAGDIVKGGKQDRVLTVSMLLTPGTGSVAASPASLASSSWRRRFPIVWATASSASRMLSV